MECGYLLFYNLLTVTTWLHFITEKLEECLFLCMASCVTFITFLPSQIESRLHQVAILFGLPQSLWHLYPVAPPQKVAPPPQKAAPPHQQKPLIGWMCNVSIGSVWQTEIHDLFHRKLGNKIHRPWVQICQTRSVMVNLLSTPLPETM